MECWENGLNNCIAKWFLVSLFCERMNYFALRASFSHQLICGFLPDLFILISDHYADILGKLSWHVTLLLLLLELTMMFACRHDDLIHDSKMNIPALLRSLFILLPSTQCLEAGLSARPLPGGLFPRQNEAGEKFAKKIAVLSRK